MLESGAEWLQRLGAMGPPLLIASVLALSVILERAVFFLAGKDREAEALNDASTACRQAMSVHGLSLPEAMALALQQQAPAYLRQIRLLKLLAGLTPMMGLLGTMLGVMRAFREVAAHPGPVTAALIADGLQEAMLTTAVGLSIALPCLFLAYLCQSAGEAGLQRLHAGLQRALMPGEQAPIGREAACT